MLKITNARVVFPDRIEAQDLYVENGTFCPAPSVPDPGTEVLDMRGLYLSPGLVDIHTHGMGGYDFMDATEEAIFGIAREHLLHGATTIIPTSLAGSREETARFLDIFKNVRHKRGDFADMPGVHMEGPYFSPQQKGAQPEKFLRNPDPEEYLPILEIYGDFILRWSSAPELPGTEAFAKAAKEKGVLLAFAHTDADYDEAVQAHAWGFTHYTHLYSCMSTVHRKNGFRHCGAVESAYLLKDTTVELICDGIHLPPELVHLAHAIKGTENVALVTDCMRATALGEGEYILGSLNSDHKVIVKGGVAWMPDMSSFAGSVSTAMDILRTAVIRCGIPLAEAVFMMTAVPSQIMKLGHKGSLTAGCDADLIAFDDDIRLHRVIKGGKEIILPNEN